MQPPSKSRQTQFGVDRREGRVNPGRAAVMSRLAAEIRRYPDLGLDALDTEGIPDRDAALAHAVLDAAIRRWLTIEQLLSQFLRQPWESLEAPTGAALLVGAAQMLFLDRVPVHSAIDESVEWTKQHARPKASGLVNAVLRRLAELVRRDAQGQSQSRPGWSNLRDELPLPDGRSLVLARPVLPPEELPRAAVAAGIPTGQVRRWADEYGEDDAIHIAWHSVCNPPTVLYAGGMASGADIGCSTEHSSALHRVFTGSRSDLVALLRTNPDLWVQDASASAALAVAGDLAAESVVVDLCAGRGTKTRQLLSGASAAQVIACEVSEPRLADLDRLAATANGRLSVVRPERAAEAWRARCSLALADVPCSNSGVLARRVEARHRCSSRQLARLGEQQRTIVTQAVGLLAPSGRLVYSTCSLEPEENRGIVDWACRTFGLQVTREQQRLPEGGPGRPPSEYQDGAYAACLSRG
ncbi:MAG: hypothetical protein IPJ41_13720 [Phycisphaerales bacterium]|nr:hypothetical protein [Phycisphaerales bacterium]